MDEIINSTDVLTLRAFEDLQSFFVTKDHKPSADMLNGLYATIDNLTLQLQGRLDSKYYVCSLDPGVGKTSAIKAWIRNYLKVADEYGNKGIILLFDRHEEIISFLDECNLSESSYGVLVGDTTTVGKGLNARGIGKDNIDKALVLFTTKQQVIRRSYIDSSFNGISAFHYLGQPRSVHIWDETLIVGKALTVNASAVLELIGTIERKGQVELSEQLRSFAISLYGCKESDLIDIPAFDTELKSGFKWETSNMRSTAETLDILSGRVAEVKVEGKGRVVLDCIESLPEDFKPCLVTDASARFRGTYMLQELYRADIVRLTSKLSNKRFDPLTVHVLHRSTSKATYSNHKEIDKVAEDVATIIMSRPTEKFLVVVTVINYKRLSRAIREKLDKSHHSMVEFLTWGRHTATNKFIEIPNVIMTSLLYYRTSDYIANMRASAVYPASEGFLPKEYLKDFQKMEIGHHILQAANRGKMRRCVGGMCPEARLWIMASKGSGVEKIAEEVFIGCSIKEWESIVPKEARGLREQLRDHVLAELLSKSMDYLTWASVRRVFGIKDQSNFKKLYLADDYFQKLCDSAGILINNDRFTFSLNPFR